MLGTELSQAQHFALINETASIRYALDSADRLLRTAGPFERERDAIFAVCSIGIEKLAKVALCLIEVDKGRGWPPIKVLNKSRDGWGHSIGQMDNRLRDVLASRVAGKEAEVFLRRMLRTVEQDAVWSHVAGSLEAYATMGRFFHRDALAGESADPTHDPAVLWDAAERAAVAASPTLASLQAAEPWTAFEIALLGSVADSIRRWWGMVALMGMHGVLGDAGKSFGGDVLPDGAVPFRFDVDAFP